MDGARASAKREARHQADQRVGAGTDVFLRFANVHVQPASRDQVPAANHRFGGVRSGAHRAACLTGAAATAAALSSLSATSGRHLLVGLLLPPRIGSASEPPAPYPGRMSPTVAAGSPDQPTPCWYCTHWGGLTGGGTAALCDRPHSARVTAGPWWGCVFWAREPGVDDVPWQPAGVRPLPAPGAATAAAVGRQVE